jgi:hypothetical protein
VIKIRSYNGSINSGGDTTGHITALLGATPGQITLTECSNTNLYLGTVNPATAPNLGVCGGAPTLPTDAQALVDSNEPIWNACNPPATFTISGAKHQDTLQGAGLPGWTIRLYTGPVAATPALTTTTTAAGGLYSFGPLGAGDYVVCEVLQAGWTQTVPNSGPACPQADEAPFGIAVHVDSNTGDATGKDFANTTVRCEKQPVQAVLDTLTGRYPGNTGPDVFVYLSDPAPANSVQNATGT